MFDHLAQRFEEFFSGLTKTVVGRIDSAIASQFTAWKVHTVDALEKSMSALSDAVVAKLEVFASSVTGLVESHNTLTASVAALQEQVAALSADKDAAESALQAASDKIDTIIAEVSASQPAA